MSFRGELNAFSAWCSVKMSPRMVTDNILQSIIKGNTMRVLLESMYLIIYRTTVTNFIVIKNCIYMLGITGHCPKRLGSLDG